MMEPIKKGYFYHIYNRGANKANLFWKGEDYRFFMEKFFYYLYPCIETYSLCLLSNHFHALIRVRTIDEQITNFKYFQDYYPVDSFHGKMNPKVKPYQVSRQLSHFMNSYTKWINKKNNRTGTLIEGPLKRKRIVDQNHFNHLVCYIHRNPIHHKITNAYSTYPYSSYKTLIGKQKTLFERSKILKQFGSSKNFIAAHEEFRLKLGPDYYLE